MKNVQKIDLGLTGYDELFMNDAERKENKLPRIYDVPISEIDDFPDHPFKVKIDEDMDQLVQSIKERGIITPVTLRPKEDGRYEIVSGHRRKKACELAGLDTIKAEVREMTRDEAIILMVESNLQRSTILPSEKAFSYKMRLEAMKRQAGTTNLFKNTTPKGSQTQDPFWDQTAAMLLKALVCYLHYEAPPDEQNFPMVMEMIRSGDVKEDNEEYQSVLDELFERLEAKNPEHIALKYYRAYHSGSAKTLKSIQISLVSRLEKFNLDSLAGITQIDEMELESIGEKKTAVFAVIPDNDSSFNFIVGMLYTQLFQQLYYQADSVHGGRLPVHVHFVMDEFANETQL